MIWKYSLIFDNNIVSEIVSQTNLYANQDKNDQQFTVSYNEICQLTGIMLLSGYNRLLWVEDP